ncbi:uncharacterized protein F4822DRAFT_414691 [Hypoxylon trugodes]|uniref:uncharacterized protein n=1 Tax=Hypoxylon trugodes TaxID=326681 RepID=UPI00219DEF4C|nr:uncharacterized protein F4822DRAFT_414691 [Hypoxylon trugodes]KAI1385999.1 hypothetical protein F4822DRAFT_414691 [Hypoxylon trugodes]
MRFTSIFVSVLSWTAIVSGRFIVRTPDQPQGLPSDYSVANLTWKGRIVDNGPEVSLTGTSFKDIESQILKVNPKFSWADPSTGGDHSEPQKSKAYLSCDPNNIWWAQAFRIQDGIQYLSGKTGKCFMEKGPRVCTRISCSYKSAIWWCNDNHFPIEENCLLWSHYAQDILDQCQTHDASSRVRGQEFSTSNWNIMVGFSNDHC